jgi:uncharacterized phage protein gp47/JayE
MPTLRNMTNTPTPSAPAEHNTALLYADTVVPGASIDANCWESWSYTDASITHYYAKGPCPACAAQVQGHATDTQNPVEGQGPDKDASAMPEKPLGDTIEIPVQCHCGFEHGKQDATGCGRSWSLIITRATS